MSVGLYFSKTWSIYLLFDRHANLSNDRLLNISQKIYQRAYFNPWGRRGKYWCPNMLSLVSFARMTLNSCAVLRIGTLTGGPLCKESLPLCRLKNPTVVYMTTCRLSSCKTGVYNVHLLIILERECSSMYRKKETFPTLLVHVLS